MNEVILRGVIIWHQYMNGRIINHTTTDFEGSLAAFQEALRVEEHDNTRQLKNAVDNQLLSIFHSFVQIS